MATGNEVDYKTATSIYDFTVKDTYGKDVSLEKYRGYVVLIVNIASQCGLTKSNYAKLTQLHNDYYDKGKMNEFTKLTLFNIKFLFGIILILFHVLNLNYFLFS